ncbi:MAG: hypothetical protein ACHP7N_02680 [Caulobacterales bacterium]
MICPANDPPAVTIEIDVVTSGDGPSFYAAFVPVPGVVDKFGNWDFHAHSRSVAVTMKLTDTSGLNRFFFDGRGSDGKDYHVFSFADDKDGDAKEPIRNGHHQFKQLPTVANGTTVTFCYHNTSRGKNNDPAGAHRYARYGLYLGDDEHPSKPFSIDPIITNGGNDSVKPQ